MALFAKSAGMCGVNIAITLWNIHQAESIAANALLVAYIKNNTLQVGNENLHKAHRVPALWSEFSEQRMLQSQTIGSRTCRD